MQHMMCKDAKKTSGTRKTVAKDKPDRALKREIELGKDIS